MNATRRLLSPPALVVAVAALVMFVCIWQTVRLRQENNDLRSTLSEPLPAAAVPSAALVNAGHTDIERIRKELEQARRRLRAAEDKAKSLASELAITPADELKSFGRLEELATKGVTLVKTMDEFLNAQQAAQLEGRRSRPAAENMPEWLVNTEVIGDLESDPAEVADLHARALRDILGLDETSTRKVQTQLTAEFAQLRAQGLDRPHRPVEGQDEWYARRDQMLLEAAARIDTQIPAPQRKPRVVAQIMNLGTAFRTRVQQIPDGSGPHLQLSYQAPGSPPVTF